MSNASSTTIGSKRRRNQSLQHMASDFSQMPIAPLAGASLVTPAKNATSAICSLPSTTAGEVISRELQLYYDRITDAVLAPDDALRAVALASIGSDPGLQALLPYFIRFVQESVSRSLRDLRQLGMLLAVLENLLNNQNFFHEPYLHQVIPILLTIVVCRQLGEEYQNDLHWTLRSHGATVLASTVLRYADSYPTLLPRVTRTLLIALLDDKKPPSTKYGAIVTLSALGPTVARACLVPHAKKFAETSSEELFEIYSKTLAHLHDISRKEIKELNLLTNKNNNNNNTIITVNSSSENYSSKSNSNEDEAAITEAYGMRLGLSVLKKMKEPFCFVAEKDNNNN